jgi:hypothetical protein
VLVDQVASVAIYVKLTDLVTVVEDSHDYCAKVFGVAGVLGTCWYVTDIFLLEKEIHDCEPSHVLAELVLKKVLLHQYLGIFSLGIEMCHDYIVNALEVVACICHLYSGEIVREFVVAALCFRLR